MTMSTLAFFNTVLEWWNALDSAEKIFTGTGALAGAVTLGLLFLTILGLDHGGVTDALDAGDAVDAGAGDGGDGSLFSTRSIAGFFLGFGGGGSIAYKHTGSVVIACAVGAVIGVILLYLIYWIAKKLMGMQSDGTVDYRQAIGCAGTVYITVPPKRASGGQAQVVFRSRHEVFNVVTDSETPLPAGASIRVKESLAPNLFLVEAL